MDANRHFKTVKYLGNQIGKPWVKSLKQVGNNPSNLNKFTYISEVVPNIGSYMITDKADGQRTFLIINADGRSTYISGVDVNNVSNAELGVRVSGQMIVDCEHLTTHDGQSLFYVFDIIMFNGANIHEKPFRERHEYLLKLAALVGERAKIRVKPYYKLTIQSYQKNIMSQYNDLKAKNYDTDGIIFTNIEANYNKTIHYKWKPLDHLTIDFLTVRATKNEYYLFSGINNRAFKQLGLTFRNYPVSYPALASKMDEIRLDVANGRINEPYFPALFRPSYFVPDTDRYVADDNDPDLHQKVVEMSFDAKRTRWVVHRIRDDKHGDYLKKIAFGNNFMFAEEIFQMTMNPLLLKDLIQSHHELTRDFYFEKSDSSYQYVRKANRFVLGIIIARYAGAKYLIDLASGKGQDLMQYYEAKIETLLMVERDISAIDNIIQRKHDFSKSIRVSEGSIDINESRGNNTTLSVVQADLNADWKGHTERIDKIGLFPKGGVPAIICNLALHYMLSSKADAENIVGLINYYLEPDGEFVFTAFDGAHLFDMLKANGGRWEVKVASKTKYLVEFAEDKQPSSLVPFGVKINVLIPCASEPYEETLVDIFALDKIFKKYNIVRVDSRRFDDHLDDFRQKKQKFYDGLSDDDKTFVGLYGYHIYKKIK